MGKSRQWVDDAVPQVVECARRHFAYVSLGAQDASRCDIKRVLDFIGLADSMDVSRIRIADTVGILSPLKTVALINDIRELYPDIDIDFHAHNDFGMATANAFTAWQAGASSLSLTVNGLGERAGNAALEETLIALKSSNGETKYNLAALYPLCRYVSEASGRAIPESKAVCGEMAFSHESGIHAGCTLVDTLAFQPFDGKEVGRESYRNLFGKHSGRKMLCHLLQTQNLPVDKCSVTGLKQRVADMAQRNRRNILPSEIVEYYRELAENDQIT